MFLPLHQNVFQWHFLWETESTMSLKEAAVVKKRLCGEMMQTFYFLFFSVWCAVCQ